MTCISTIFICLPLDCVALQFCCKRSKITDRISLILAIFIMYHLTSSTVSGQLWESNMTRFHTTPLIWTLAFLQSSSTLYLGRPNWRTSPKTTKCQMWSASLKLSSHLLPFGTREELKISNRGPKQMRRSITLRHYCW